MDKLRYLTRYNGQKGTPNSFSGWRLCITRQKEIYVRYFTDREYEGKEEAMLAALETRDAMLAELEQGLDFQTVCRNHSKKSRRRS